MTATAGSPVERAAVIGSGVATREPIDQLMRDAYGRPTGPHALLGGAKEGWGDAGSGSAGRAPAP